MRAREGASGVGGRVREKMLESRVSVKRTGRGGEVVKVVSEYRVWGSDKLQGVAG